MDAKEALEGYGYILDEASGFYFRGDTEAWKPVDGGWLCVRPVRGSQKFSAPGVADPSNGQPWGREIAEVPGWLQVPDGLADRWREVGGLHPATHPECFEWIWPDERVAEIYEFASTDENRWVRQEDGTLVPA